MIKDLSGKTFSNVYVDKYDGSDKYGHAYFICKCLICGKQFRSLGTNLLSGRTISCGCIANKNREYGRKKTLQEAFEFDTNIGRLRSNNINRNNKTGIRGVHYIKSRDYYQAKITFKKIPYVLKTSKDIDKCIAARREAEKHIYGDFLKWYENFKQQEKEIINKIKSDTKG